LAVFSTGWKPVPPNGAAGNDGKRTNAAFAVYNLRWKKKGAFGGSCFTLDSALSRE